MTEEYDPDYNGFANYDNRQDYHPYSNLEEHNDQATTNGTDYASYSKLQSNEETTTTHQDASARRRRDFDDGKLFIGGLSWDTTDEGLNEYFGQFGKIIDSVVMKDGAGKSRGFAFVTYEDPAVVRTVMAKQVHLIDNKQVDPKPAISREIQVKAEKMFVGSIPPSVSEADLTEYFTRFGKPMDVSLMMDHETGISRGFAFVTFENDESLRNALNAGPHELGGSVLEVNKAIPRRSGAGPASSGKRDHYYPDESQRPFYSSSRDRGGSRRGPGSGPDRSSRYRGPRNDYYSSSDYAAYAPSASSPPSSSSSSHYGPRSSGSTAAAAASPHSAYAYPSPNQAYHGYPPYYYDPSYYGYPHYDPSTGGESSYAPPSAGSGGYYPPHPGYYAPPPPPPHMSLSSSSESMRPEGEGSNSATGKQGPYASYPPYYPPYPPPSHYAPHPHPPHASSASSHPPSSYGGTRGSGGGGSGSHRAGSRAPPTSHSRPYGSNSGNGYDERDRDRDRDRDGKQGHGPSGKPHYHPYSKR